MANALVAAGEVLSMVIDGNDSVAAVEDGALLLDRLGNDDGSVMAVPLGVTPDEAGAAVETLGAAEMLTELPTEPLAELPGPPVAGRVGDPDVVPQPADTRVMTAATAAMTGRVLRTDTPSAP